MPVLSCIDVQPRITRLCNGRMLEAAESDRDPDHSQRYGPDPTSVQSFRTV